jgi:hypothetical protein
MIDPTTAITMLSMLTPVARFASHPPKNRAPGAAGAGVRLQRR